MYTVQHNFITHLDTFCLLYDLIFLLLNIPTALQCVLHHVCSETCKLLSNNCNCRCIINMLFTIFGIQLHWKIYFYNFPVSVFQETRMQTIYILILCESRIVIIIPTLLHLRTSLPIRSSILVNAVLMSSSLAHNCEFIIHSSMRDA
jgi:hypothetical protein